MSENRPAFPASVYGYWRPWKENANYLNDYLDYVRDATLIKYGTNAIGKFDASINEMMENLKISFSKRSQEFNDLDVQLTVGFKTMFDDIRKTTTKLFDDEKANIKEIRKDVKEIKDIKVELSNLSSIVRDQARKIENLPGGNNVHNNLPNYLKYLVIIFLSLGIISFITYLF